MPVSETLRELTQDRVFWASYLAGARPPGAGELRVGFPVAGGYGLVLDLDLDSGEHALGLRQPTSTDPVHLGGTGAGRPAAAVLHWTELDLIGRVLALDDPTLPHPGLPVALLARFTPVSGTADAAAAGALLPAAYRSLRRHVEPVPPVAPEQAPLPLFTGAEWWPQPVQPSDRVLAEEDVATYLAAHAGRIHEPRPDRGPWFPEAGLTELLRHARARLDRLRESDWYGPAGALPLARRICLGADLAGVPALVEALAAAGCDHPTVLDGLTGPVVPVEAGWIVETLAGVEPGTLLGQLAGTDPAAGRAPGPVGGGY